VGSGLGDGKTELRSLSHGLFLTKAGDKYSQIKLKSICK
jgi:hypothetical protein